MHNAITSFRGEYHWLSNFWPSEVKYGAFIHPTVEHAYQAAKTTNHDVQADIAQLPSPGEAKRMGRKLALRPDWEEIKVEVMYHLLCQKFSDSVLAMELMRTGNRELVEGNHWGDTYWGVCGGVGQNMLGKLLMCVRAKLICGLPFR